MFSNGIRGVPNPDAPRSSKHRRFERGIPQRLVELALQHGRVEGDRHVLDKGRVTVVEDVRSDSQEAKKTV